MRFAHQRVSPLKKNNHDSQKAITNTNWNPRINSQNIYMHYNNSIFMGNMVSYKRNGQAVILFDQGTSAVCDYSFDTMVGHNIFYAYDSIASLLILKKGSYEIAVRTGYFIFKIPFYECQNQPNGNGVLIDFKNNTMYHLIYQCGKLVRKIVETNKDVLINVYKQNLKSILDIRHQQAFKFEVKFKNGIKIEKLHNKILIGFYDHFNNLDGVCFKLHVDQNKYNVFSHPLELKCVQRGFYHKGRLQNYGQRCFTNGNLYIGQFSNDFFEGKGLLLYPTEQKWVFGQFEKEKLTKMIDTSVNEQSSITSIKANIKYLLKSIHQLNPNNWINTKIDNFMWTQLFNRFQQSIQTETTDIVVEKQKEKRQQEERLRRIQMHFSSEKPNNQINRVLKTQKIKNRISPQKIKINQYTSKTAKVLGVEPRYTENELYWSKEPSWKITPKDNLQRRHNDFSIKQQIQYQGSLQKQKVSPLKSKIMHNQLYSKTVKRRDMNDLYNSFQY